MNFLSVGVEVMVFSSDFSPVLSEEFEASAYLSHFCPSQYLMSLFLFLFERALD